MKNKVIVGALAVICVVSVGFNIYLYNVLNVGRQQLSDTQAELDNMGINYADLETQIMAMQEELDTLTASISDKQSENDSLAKENSELLSSISELEESIVAVVEDEEDETDEVDEADKAETTHTQTTDTASTTQSTASNQNVDTAAQERMLQKAAENGFSISNGDTNIVEATDRTTGINDVGMWE